MTAMGIRTTMMKTNQSPNRSTLVLEGSRKLIRQVGKRCSKIDAQEKDARFYGEAGL